MSDTLLALVPQYGIALVFLATFFSCLALPVPSSLIMLSAGAFAAGGDLSLIGITLGAFAGAAIGDQVGFAIGKYSGEKIERFSQGSAKRAALFDRAQSYVQNRGGLGVFFSRWLVSPLGPYVNALSGAAGMNWRLFTFWDLLGEAVWVCIYVGLGFTFAGQIEAVSQILGNLSGALAAGLVTILLGKFLFKRAKASMPEKQL